ncbi:MAG: hypothetical protein IPI95_15585, partial [Flavobacteriales bacterium]|nr:hypothetical protein [Flavobacteriales bacterium]
SPVRVLVPPRHKRMLAIGADHRFSARTKAWGEVAVSDEDRNTFSSVDDADNTALAVRAGASHAIPISRSDSTKQMVVGTDNEWRSKDFRVVERYRTVEFDRDWNIAGVVQDGDQVLSTVSIGLLNGKQGKADLSSSIFHIDQRYDGFRQALRGNMRFGKFDATLDGSLLNTSAGSSSSGFLRNKAVLARRFNRFTLGVSDELERNLFRNDSLDALTAGSYQYNDWEAFVQSPDSAKAKFRLSAGQRYMTRPSATVPSPQHRGHQLQRQPGPRREEDPEARRHFHLPPTAHRGHRVDRPACGGHLPRPLGPWPQRVEGGAELGHVL